MTLAQLNKILIIDDDEDDTFIIKDRLEQCCADDVEFKIVQGFDQAVKSLASNEFDMCFLDFYLGSFQGNQILAALQGSYCLTPIIMLTGMISETQGQEAINMGAQDYINKKDIDSAAFIKSIQYAVSRKALEIANLERFKLTSESESKDKFISHLSHELRTPLTSIIGYTQLLLEQSESQAIQEQLRIINNNSVHLLNLLDDVLDLSKISAGKFELQPRECDVHQFFKDIQNIVVMSARGKDLGLTFRLAGKLPSHIIIDQTRLSQVLLNIITNAIKFTENGMVDVLVSVLPGEEQQHLRIAVTDTGIGIAADKLSTIFTPFTQLEDIASRRVGGAGLGLSISKEIVERMQGALHAASKVGEGSCFEITIPLEPAAKCVFAPINIKAPPASQQQHVSVQFAAKALVVDDVVEIRTLLSKMLALFGVDVVTAGSASQALARVDEGVVFDVIFLDLQMPRMTGQQCFGPLKALHPTGAIVAMTAGKSHGLERALIAQGFDGFLKKPIEKSALLAQLTQHINHKRERSARVPSVILIEDDIDSAQLMMQLLQKLGVQVSVIHTFADVAPVLTRCDAPNCTIIADLHLNDTPPRQLLNAIRTHQPEAKLCLVSGMPISAELITEYGVAKTLLKPISLQQLKELVSTK